MVLLKTNKKEHFLLATKQTIAKALEKMCKIESKINELFVSIFNTPFEFLMI